MSRIRCGSDQLQDVGKKWTLTVPVWVEQVDWTTVLVEIGRGYEIKKIWKERSQGLTTYANFCKQLHKRHPELMKSSVTLREFASGDRCEVDYACDRIEWMDIRTGEIHQDHVFIGILCFSQLIFS